MDMGCALWTWDVLYGHGRCLLVAEEYELCGYALYGHGTCRRVGEEHVDIDMWIWEMSSHETRIYGYGRCLFVEDFFIW